MPKHHNRLPATRINSFVQKEKITTCEGIITKDRI